MKLGDFPCVDKFVPVNPQWVGKPSPDAALDCHLCIEDACDKVIGFVRLRDHDIQYGLMFGNACKVQCIP